MSYILNQHYIGREIIIFLVRNSLKMIFFATLSIFCFSHFPYLISLIAFWQDSCDKSFQEVSQRILFYLKIIRHEHHWYWNMGQFSYSMIYSPHKNAQKWIRRSIKLAFWMFDFNIFRFCRWQRWLTYLSRTHFWCLVAGRHSQFLNFFKSRFSVKYFHVKSIISFHSLELSTNS